MYREARWSFSTLVVIVAEKRKVVRSLGMTLSTLVIGSSKSMFSNLSASSRTRNLRFRREKPLVFSRWSTSLPGEHTMTCGFFDRATACVIISTPPISTVVRTPMGPPRASNCSAI